MKSYFLIISTIINFIFCSSLYASDRTEQIADLALSSPCYEILKNNNNIKKDEKKRIDLVIEGKGCKSFTENIIKLASIELGEVNNFIWGQRLVHTEFYMGVKKDGSIDWDNVSFAWTISDYRGKNWQRKGRSKDRCEAKSVTKKCALVIEKQIIVNPELKKMASDYIPNITSANNQSVESQADQQSDFNPIIQSIANRNQDWIDKYINKNDGPFMVYSIINPCFNVLRENPNQEIKVETDFYGPNVGYGCAAFMDALRIYDSWTMWGPKAEGAKVFGRLEGKILMMGTTSSGEINWKNPVTVWGVFKESGWGAKYRENYIQEFCNKNSGSKCKKLFVHDQIVAKEIKEQLSNYTNNGKLQKPLEVFAQIEEKRVKEIKIELEKQKQLEIAQLEEEKRKLEDENRKVVELEKKRKEEERKRLAEEEKKKKAEEEIKRQLANKDRKAAEKYLNFLIEFTERNPNEFEIIKLTELISNVKEIKEGKWSDKLKNNFKKLKSFTSKSNDFNLFVNKRIQNEKRLAQQEIKDLQNTISNTKEYLLYYLRQNLLSEIAPDILNEVARLENDRILDDTNKLKKSIDQSKDFLIKNNLASEHTQFISKLVTSNNSDLDIELSNIENLNLDQFDFWNDATDNDFIAVINLSGNAPNAFLGINGEIKFENDFALSCFYQQIPIDDDIKYYIFDKVSNREYLAQDREFECDNSNILAYDLLFFRKSDLLKEDKTYYKNLVYRLIKEDLRFLMKVSEQDYKKDFLAREIISEKIVKDIKNQSLTGYGALIIQNKSKILCSDVTDFMNGHESVINALSNEFIRMGYKKSPSIINFNETEKIFIDTQRRECGFLYANQSSLKVIIEGLDKSNIKYEMLPVWMPFNEVKKRHEDIVAYNERVKDDIEKNEALEKQRLESEGIIKAEKQNKMRKASSDEVNAFLEKIRKDAKKFVNEETISNSWINDSFPKLSKYYKKKFKEGWEMAEYSFELIDFGTSNFKTRKISTFFTNMNFKFMHRDLGEYERGCVTIAFISDKEFDRTRKPISESCENLRVIMNYKAANEFESKWIVN